MNAQELRAELSQHYGGSETVYFHALNKSFHYSPGMKAMFDHAGGGARWLSDILATQPEIQLGVHRHGFCVGVLAVRDSKAQLTVSKDMRAMYGANDEVIGYEPLEVVYERTIDWTDFPEGDWKIYLTWTSVGGKSVPMALLPNEY